MLTRILAVLGVGVWCLFILLVSVVFVIDRGLAKVGIVWLAVFGIGVVAPVLLLGQINRALAAHEGSRRAAPDTRKGTPRRPGGERRTHPCDGRDADLAHRR